MDKFNKEKAEGDEANEPPPPSSTHANEKHNEEKAQAQRDEANGTPPTNSALAMEKHNEEKAERDAADGSAPTMEESNEEKKAQERDVARANGTPPPPNNALTLADAGAFRKFLWSLSDEQFELEFELERRRRRELAGLPPLSAPTFPPFLALPPGGAAAGPGLLPYAPPLILPPLVNPPVKGGRGRPRKQAKPLDDDRTKGKDGEKAGKPTGNGIDATDARAPVGASNVAIAPPLVGAPAVPPAGGTAARPLPLHRPEVVPPQTQATPPVKRGRGRPRKHLPLNDGAKKRDGTTSKAGEESQGERSSSTEGTPSQKSDHGTVPPVVAAAAVLPFAPAAPPADGTMANSLPVQRPQESPAREPANPLDKRGRGRPGKRPLADTAEQSDGTRTGETQDKRPKKAGSAMADLPVQQDNAAGNGAVGAYTQITVPLFYLPPAAYRPRKKENSGEKKSPKKENSALDKERTWLKRLEELKEYKIKFGDFAVPRSYNSLGRWVQAQRYQLKRHADGRTSTMTRERIELLESIGFGDGKKGPVKVCNRTRVNEIWEARYQELVAFRNEHGHCDVSRSKHGQDYKLLANWCDTQRQAFKTRKKKMQNAATNRLNLTDEQMTKLAAIGFRFQLRDDFEARLKQLLDYKARHGHTRVPVGYQGHNNLGKWICHIRTFYHKNKLSADRLAKLNALDFDFSLRSQGVAGKARNKEEAKPSHSHPSPLSRPSPPEQIGGWQGGNTNFWEGVDEI